MTARNALFNNKQVFYGIIGYEAGEEQQDRDNDAGLGYHGCPVGHIREYCMGYKSGSSEESSALDT